MINILALASWYPNNTNKQNGDFVKRHLEAFSSNYKITLLTIVKDNSISKKFIIDYKKINENLEEIIVYYKFKRDGNYLYKTRSTLRFLDLGRKIYKTLIEKNHYDQIHVHVSWRMIMLGREISTLENIPMYVFEHNTDLLRKNKNPQRELGYFIYLSLLLGFKYSFKNFAVSEILAGDIQKTFKLKKKPTVLSNVVDTNLFNYKIKNNTNFEFFHASSGDSFKKVENILYAFEKYCQSEEEGILSIATPKSEKFKKIESTFTYSKDRIIWLDRIPYEKIAYYLQKSNALIMASDFETQSCITIEALCCGTPVLAPNVSAFPESINDTNGFLIQNNDVDSLVMGMKEIKNIKFDHEQISRNAINKYNYETITKKLEENIF